VALAAFFNLGDVLKLETWRKNAVEAPDEQLRCRVKYSGSAKMKNASGCESASEF
jgi:hypothetical protein